MRIRKYICIECEKQYYEQNRDKIKKRHKQYHKRNRDKILGQMKQHRKYLKQQVLDHYGAYCHCPGGCMETKYEFLTIEHLNGDGAEHRRKIGGKTGAAFASWLIRNNFPPGFTILCYNCNCAKGYFGYCPHETLA